MYIKKLLPIDEGLKEPDYCLDANRYKCNSGSDFSGGSCCIAIFQLQTEACRVSSTIT